MIGVYKWGRGDNSSYRFSQALGRAGVINIGRPPVIINLNQHSSGIELVLKTEIKIIRTDNQVPKSAGGQIQARISSGKSAADGISNENHPAAVNKSGKTEKIATVLSAHTILKN